MSRERARHKPLNDPLTKVSRHVVEEGCISVSLRYLSKNKRRNFEFFGDKRWRDKARVLEQFFSFLQRLTAKRRIDIMKLAKDADCGFEHMRYGAINCTPDGYELSSERLILVFRFGNNSAGSDYRLLGFFEDNSPVLNIIGFDFDYSAYPHE